MHFIGQRHVADKHHAGDILGSVRDRILQVQNFEKIASVDGQKQALRQMCPKLVLDVVGIAFKRVDPAAY